MREIVLSSLVGGGYAAFWEDRSRYRLIKGGRGSKKSKTTALNLLVRLMEHEGANLLCVRKTGATLHDSVFADLLWAAERLEVSPLWRVTRSPLRMKFLPNGNEVLFRGLDDALKLTSISVPHGMLCWIWVEEAYELRDREEFEKLDLTLRGQTPDGLFKQMTLTFNPWQREHWLFDLFERGEDVFARTTTYLCNEFLDEADLRLFMRMKRDQPERYRVEGLGEWGIPGGAVFTNLSNDSFDESGFDNWFEGLDWGFADDPLAWVRVHYDRRADRLYICDELLRPGLSNRQAYELLRERSGTVITADSAEPKSIAELRGYGLRIRPAKKGAGSVLSGLRWLQGLRGMVIHPRCVNARRELHNLAFDRDSRGLALPRTRGEDHLTDALRYALEGELGRRTTYAYKP